MYDSENGTTCHQCRQKTAEVKAKCRWMIANLGYIDINLLDDLDPINSIDHSIEHRADRWGDPDWSVNPGRYALSTTKDL